MIKTKADLKYYLKSDQIALGKETLNRPRFGRDEIWRFERLLRYTEYYSNNRNSFFNNLAFYYLKFCFHRLSVRLGFSIPINVFDEGLSIAHYGSIVVNDKAKIGKNCRIQENVTIGSTGGNEEAPTIGNNVFIASGVRVIGNITIGDNIAIGANAVVVHDFLESGITVGGIPAKKISDKGSKSFMFWIGSD